MTPNEVALKLAEIALEISDDCAMAGDIDNAHEAAYVARRYCCEVDSGDADSAAWDGDADWRAYLLSAYSHDADWFATQCSLG